ncbi:MAG: DUF2007 domain-containing protein [Verrucomicrobiales bacterium]|jgi:hypothetical protein|nr:DUF2007 domain-containing protein [Verrucomicrobiales bacterium]
MRMVRHYSKSEDAYLAASSLGANGIEAFVIDDNAIGGNLLGVLQKSAIRIEVSESDYDEAYRILTEFEDNIRSKD